LETPSCDNRKRRNGEYTTSETLDCEVRVSIMIPNDLLASCAMSLASLHDTGCSNAVQYVTRCAISGADSRRTDTVCCISAGIAPEAWTGDQHQSVLLGTLAPPGRAIAVIGGIVVPDFD